ncbi:MAG: hypothetical protein QOF84_1429 [Streptomyces sp.]|nr:hypothetical protein [Streptomyces sp.]
MFTVDQRQCVRAQLTARARHDPRITAAALTGSAARDAEDRWSDVDLFLGVADGVAVPDVLADWTAYAYAELGALHHFDLRAGPATYRAFLLADLLEIDLGLTPAAVFGPLGDGEFRVLFGEAVARVPGAADPDHLIGLAWHHILHARTSIARGAPWQAEHWISALRDHTLALACLRLGLPAAHAKGADRLPPEVTAPLREVLVRSLDTAELSRALRAATRAFLRELRETDAEAAERLEKPLGG